MVYVEKMEENEFRVRDEKHSYAVFDSLKEANRFKYMIDVQNLVAKMGKMTDDEQDKYCRTHEPLKNPDVI